MVALSASRLVCFEIASMVCAMSAICLTEFSRPDNRSFMPTTRSLSRRMDSRAPRISVSQPSVSTRTAWASALVAVLDAESSEIVFASASTAETIVAVLSATSRTSWVIHPTLVAARADFADASHHQLEFSGRLSRHRLRHRAGRKGVRAGRCGRRCNPCAAERKHQRSSRRAILSWRRPLTASRRPRKCHATESLGASARNARVGYINGKS